MTRVRFYHDLAGFICGFSVIGHAGQAEKGEDIVCAGLSALTITAANALETVAKVQPLVRTRDGFLSVRLPRKGLSPRQAHDARVILRTVRRGLADMAAAYPQYVRVTK